MLRKPITLRNLFKVSTEEKEMGSALAKTLALFLAFATASTTAFATECDGPDFTRTTLSNVIWGTFSHALAEAIIERGIGPLSAEQKLAIRVAREQVGRQSIPPGQVITSILERVFSPAHAHRVYEEVVLRRNPYFQGTHASSSPSRLSAYREVPLVTMPVSEYRQWSHADARAHRGLLLYYQGGSRNVSVGQRLLLLDDFPRSERRLIRGLLARSRHRRLVNRDIIHQARIDRGDLPRPPDQDIVDRLRPWATTPSVEVGEWRLELANGRVIRARMTSGLLRSIDGAHVGAAISSVMSKYQVPLSSIRSVQFFHTHPVDGAPLSYSDMEAILKIRSQLWTPEYTPEVHVYAISTIEDQPVIYQLGL